MNSLRKESYGKLWGTKWFAKQHLWKIQFQWMIIIKFQQTRNREELPQLVKVHPQNIHSRPHASCDKLKLTFRGQEWSKDVTPLLLHTVLKVLPNALRQEKAYIHWKRSNQTHYSRIIWGFMYKKPNDLLKNHPTN